MASIALMLSESKAKRTANASQQDADSIHFCQLQLCHRQAR